jgi:hypothetical protein
VSGRVRVGAIQARAFTIADARRRTEPRWRRHLQIDRLGGGQGHRHRLWVKRAHLCIRRRGEEAVSVRRDRPFLHLPRRCPLRHSDAPRNRQGGGSRRKRTRRAIGDHRLRVRLREACEWHQAAAPVPASGEIWCSRYWSRPNLSSCPPARIADLTCSGAARRVPGRRTGPDDRRRVIRVGAGLHPRPRGSRRNIAGDGLAGGRLN